MSAVAASRRGGILQLQSLMQQGIENKVLKPANVPVEHYFAPGQYGRKAVLPKGSRVIGKIHRHAHLNFIMSGHCTVATEDGVKVLRGGDIFVSQPGTKRVVYANQRTVWVTVHVTDHTDLAKIEEEIIAPSFESIGLDVAHKELPL